MLMLELVETELERLLKICLEKTIWVSRRHFGSVYSPQYFKSVNGDTAFSYKALKTSVIRTVESDLFAVRFQYFNDSASLVVVINNQVDPVRFIQAPEACILSKTGVPLDNFKKHKFILDLALKFLDIQNVLKLCVSVL